MEDYEGALDCYQQALRGKEKALGKTNPGTLATIMNMANEYQVGLKDFTKAEEMYTIALDGHVKSPVKDHEHTKLCARGLAILLETVGSRKKDLRKLLHDYLHLEQDESWGV